MANWSMPKVTRLDNGVSTWECKTFAAPPDLTTTFILPADTNYAARHDAAAASARSLTRVDDVQAPPWLWNVQIFFRRLNYANRGTDARGREVPIGPGVKLPTTWSRASAYLIKEAHNPGEKAQWLMTAAHNFATITPECDKDGIITDFGRMQSYPTDSVYVVAGQGPSRHGAWVDRISIMNGYYDDPSGAMATRRFDGAAFHIKNSDLAAAFYVNAPSIAYLPPGPQVTYTTATFVIPGYPGEINMFQDLAGMYIAGRHIHGGVGTTYTDFDAVRVTRDQLAISAGALTWNEDQCPTAQGVSGSACVLVINGVPYIIGSVNTNGTAGTFRPFIWQSALQVVSPEILLTAIGAKEIHMIQVPPPAAVAGPPAVPPVAAPPVVHAPVPIAPTPDATAVGRTR